MVGLKDLRAALKTVPVAVLMVALMAAIEPR